MDKQVQTALINVTTIVVNTRLTAQEHAQLQNDLALIRQRCARADEYEQEMKEPKKDEE